MHELWQRLAQASDRELDNTQVQLLERYLALLIDANARVNLTRVTDPDQGRLLHIADSLTLLRHIPPDCRMLADIGSGGGVPGIPLAIALPETRVVLIEATGKKCRFLTETAEALGLRNLEVRAVRAEDAGRSDLRESCDVVTARAVGALVFVVEWCLPLARKGGRVLAMKGPKLVEELPPALKPIKTLGGAEPTTHAVADLPGVEGHVICRIDKLTRTPDFFPRSATAAKGKPMAQWL
jgi:16S rRNA (guanine527-N7)-methyltransferase